MPAIIVENLAKKYYLGRVRHETSFREAVTGWTHRLFSRSAREEQAIYALRNVSFQVKRGEVVGIIGRNGAGKSTLLKLLSRITYPTDGEVRVRGRIGSLLEVGTGFHHELTGRENIYLNGSILGMTKKEITRKLDAIIAFSGVEKFIDTPIKRYSSGMRLRLGFAVAAHLDPDILLVDEVLAVGDAEFQKKCLRAMDDLHSGGRTVLFVSHNMAAVEHLCPRCIWIEGGTIREDGPSHEVIRHYLSAFVAPHEKGFDFSNISTRRGQADGQIIGLQYLDESNKPKSVIRSGDKLTIRLKYRIHRPIPAAHFGLEVFTDLGTMVTSANTWMTGLQMPILPVGTGHVDLKIDFLNLMPRCYYLTLWLKSATGQMYDALEHCATMEVETSNYYRSGRGIDSRFGLVFMPCQWQASPTIEHPHQQTAPDRTAIA